MSLLDHDSARIVFLNVSPGGVPKFPVPMADVSELGLAGDGHSDGRHHGGPERALSLYSLELIDALRAEGHPIAPGTTGENVTVAGLDWRAVVPGARVQLGDAVIAEVTSYAAPCKTIRKSFIDEHFARISDKRHPGWSRVYARVIRPGTLQVGDSVRLAGV